MTAGGLGGERRTLLARAVTPQTVTLGFAGIWIVVVVVPLFGLFAYSVLTVVQFHVEFKPTLSAWREVLESGRGEVMLRTLRIATTVTMIELLVAFPFAFWLSKQLKSIPAKVAILTLTVVPFFLSSSARTIVWRPILSSTGLINNLLVETGVSRHPLEWLLFTETSVHFGLILAFFPSMLFPLFLSISLIDNDYLSASADLGASPLRTLWTVTLPLSAPGIVAGTVFTIVPMLGEIAVPRLLGGGNVNLLGQSIESALNALNYGAAAAMCAFVLIVLAFLLLLLQRIARRSGLLSVGFGALLR